MIHTNTPALAAIDPRGLSVRGVAYHRRDPAATVPDSHVTQRIHDIAGRAVLSRDPRLFRLQQTGQTGASQINRYSLSGALLLSDNNDGGWRLALMSEDGASAEGWDQKRSHSRLIHDQQRRPVAVFENAEDGAERCIARFTYADATADGAHNQRGQLIRHDDSAGTLHVLEFGRSGVPLAHSRTFLQDPQWPVDWPVIESARDAVLEDQPAITRIHCNAAGEPDRQTDARGNLQTFRHTRAGQLRAVGLTLAETRDELTLLSDIEYNALSLVERQRAGNGVVSSATFSAEDGRLQRLTAGLPGQAVLQDLSYGYDPVGNITCLTDAANPLHFHRNQRVETGNRYAYDTLDRLIDASGRQLRKAPGGPQLPDFQSAPDPGQLENYRRIYTYDEAGNLQVMHHQAGDASRTERTAIGLFNNRSLPQKPDGELPDEVEIAAAYDVNGNRLWLQPGQCLQWNLRNQLRQVDLIIRQDAPDDIEFYGYDDSGQRLRKIRQTYTGTLTRSHETRYLPGLEIRTSAEEILQVITVKAGRGSVQVLHWQKEPDSDIAQDQQRYSFSDHLNSSTLELDAAARLISWENYYPYGGTCWWAGRSELEASYKTLRYSGQERDASGLYYYGFRYYAPWLQRWLSADPAGVAAGLNLYAMVGGNPMRYVDFQGLAEVTPDRINAASAAALHRAAAAALSFAVQLAVRTGLEQIEPSHDSNFTLQGLAAVLEGGAAGYTSYGLAKSFELRTAFVVTIAAVATLGFATPALLSEQGFPPAGTDPEVHRDAIGRITSVMGALAYQFAMDSFTAGAEIQFSSSAGVRDKFKSMFIASWGYAAIRAGMGALNSFFPAVISGVMGFVAEGADGFMESSMRPYPSDKTRYVANTNAGIPNSWTSTFQGAVTRTVGGSINRFLGGFVPVGLDAVTRGAVTGLIGFFTEFRPLVANQMKKGFIKSTLPPADAENPRSNRRSVSTDTVPVRGYHAMFN